MPEYRLITENAFNLLLSLEMSFTQAEFLHALSFTRDEMFGLSTEDLVDLCSGFVIIDTEINVFRFAHLSVREYLQTRAEYRPEATHAVAAQYCLRYLCTASRVFFSWVGNETTFVDHVQEYAYLHWANHAAGSKELRLVCPLNRIFQEFIMNTDQMASRWFTAWNDRLLKTARNINNERTTRVSSRQQRLAWQYCQILNVLHDPADYLLVASLFGFLEVLEVRLRSKPDPLSILDRVWGFDALRLVCHYCRHDVAEFLLDHGWPLQSSSDERSLLEIAINGLPDHGTITGEYDDMTWRKLRAILAMAPPLGQSEYDKIGEDAWEKLRVAVALLSRHGADPNREMSRSRPVSHQEIELIHPIIKAVEVKSEKLVKLLLDHGANPDVEDRYGISSYHNSALTDTPSIVEMLLAASTDADGYSRAYCREFGQMQRAISQKDPALLEATLELLPQNIHARVDHAMENAVFPEVWEAGARLRHCKNADDGYLSDNILARIAARNLLVFHFFNPPSILDTSFSLHDYFIAHPRD